MSTSYTAIALEGIPLVQPHDDLVALILDALTQTNLQLQSGDVLIIASKILSRAENRFVNLKAIEPSEEAYQVANETGKSPQYVEVVLQESQLISRRAKGVLVTQHRLGFVSANSGIDQSNVDGTGETLLLLPHDPDASAEAIRAELAKQTGAKVGIVISDTHGRPFRLGNVGTAIGVAGLPALVDLRGQTDLFGRELEISLQGYADMIASAAHLLCGEADEGRPVVLLRGLQFDKPYGKASDLYRSPEEDLYR